MKKIIITLAIGFSTLCSFANDGNVSEKVLNAFKTEFSTAKEVAWTEGNNYFKAEFLFNENYVSAFFNADGELMAVTRYISSLDLPVSLQADLKKSYSNYWISDLFELSSNDATSYYITLENAGVKIVLKASPGDKWSVFQKSTKA
jgi:hypothetical protein